jgi:long-chain acyl-CoA synthetase
MRNPPSDAFGDIARITTLAELFAWRVARTPGCRRARGARLHLGHDRQAEGRDAHAPQRRLAWPLLERVVARPLRARFGGRLRVAVSGGAPLTADRELLVRGPNVMRGYWQREDDTARAFIDGWLRTGDQAAIEGGRVRILGRLKEIIVTSTGEKIAPADLELAITTDPWFEQACVVGDNRPFIACIVVLARTAWAQLAADLQLDAAAPASLEAEAARAAVLQRIRDATRAFPHHAQPRAVALTLAPWTVENTLMTPTLKLKRHPLAARFAHEIERLYAR